MEEIIEQIEDRRRQAFEVLADRLEEQMWQVPEPGFPTYYERPRLSWGDHVACWVFRVWNFIGRVAWRVCVWLWPWFDESDGEDW